MINDKYIRYNPIDHNGVISNILSIDHIFAVIISGEERFTKYWLMDDFLLQVFSLSDYGTHLSIKSIFTPMYFSKLLEIHGNWYTIIYLQQY